MGDAARLSPNWRGSPPEEGASRRGSVRAQVEEVEERQRAIEQQRRDREERAASSRGSAARSSARWTRSPGSADSGHLSPLPPAGGCGGGEPQGRGGAQATCSEGAGSESPRSLSQARQRGRRGSGARSEESTAVELPSPHGAEEDVGDEAFGQPADGEDGPPHAERRAEACVIEMPGCSERGEERRAESPPTSSSLSPLARQSRDGRGGGHQGGGRDLHSGDAGERAPAGVDLCGDEPTRRSESPARHRRPSRERREPSSSGKSGKKRRHAPSAVVPGSSADAAKEAKPSSRNTVAAALSGWELRCRDVMGVVFHPFVDRQKGFPMRGKLLVTYTTSAVILFVFLQELVVNITTFNGRCISPVIYPSYDAPPDERMPRVISFGYGACEHNLGGSAFPHSDSSAGGEGDAAAAAGDGGESQGTSPRPTIRRCASGSCASDRGWPSSLVRRGDALEYAASFDSPNARVFTPLGGLDTNKIRNYGEVFRVFWSMNLHGGWIHLLVNLLCQVQTLWIIEPAWGFLRTLLLWCVSGVSGNLLSAVVDPCTVTVGSSGAFYGLLGALLPFAIEYWDYIGSPAWLVFSILMMVLLAHFGNMIGLRSVDNNAHLGGYLGGLLFGFATIRSVHGFRWQGVTERMASSCLCSWMFPSAKRDELQGANRQRLARARRQRHAGQLRPPQITWKLRGHEREWCIRLVAFVGLQVFWIVLWLYLLVPSYYESLPTPPGRFSFSGHAGCHCCRVKPFPGEETKLSPHHTIRVNEGVFWCFTTARAADVFCGRKALLAGEVPGNTLDAEAEAPVDDLKARLADGSTVGTSGSEGHDQMGATTPGATTAESSPGDSEAPRGRVTALIHMWDSARRAYENLLKGSSTAAPTSASSPDAPVPAVDSEVPRPVTLRGDTSQSPETPDGKLSAEGAATAPF
ncbi:rhomboid protease ROM5 [Besnoitia besnoiti]|uniref:Rhomboid-like protease n=1 Tax=Besnoitia besnoiti TaxID=94643 RepID=A0A2A9M8C0_BESBE|nr:rhomboid protease ROM5 [Besnoitia besnoiti]PFH31630.1 rhomboid protease ROM5 [Besnoitia besnoiti]